MKEVLNKKSPATKISLKLDISGRPEILHMAHSCQQPGTYYNEGLVVLRIPDRFMSKTGL